jgi:mono/diheme cytochrome c family protein
MVNLRMRKPDISTRTRPARYFRLRLAVLVACPIALLSVLAGCHSTPPPTPLAELNTQQIHGYKVFQVHCAQCHYDRVSEPLHGPPLRGVFKKPYLPSGAPANDERVLNTILHGRNMMPAQPDLDPDDLTDLLAYLHTL